ncbi:MAG TPA: hypothetical protein VGA99_02015 [bacterium]
MSLKRYLKLSFAVLSSIFLTSCYVSPPPVYQLSPVPDSGIWWSGKQYAADSTNGISTFVAYQRSDRHHLIFEVEFTNQSEEQVLVSPEDFYYLPLQSAEDTVSQREVHALNPETELLEIDKSLSREHASYATHTAIDLTVSLLDLVLAIVSPDDAASYEERLAWEVNRADYQQLHQARVSELKGLREEWEFETLRKTTMNPGEQIRGRVYFPITKQAQFIELVLPIGRHPITLIFKQIKHRAS